MKFEGERFIVEITDHAYVGIYLAKITIKVEDAFIEYEWKLEVLNLCALTIIKADNNINKLQLEVGGDIFTPIDLTFIDSVSQ